jgi:hypothetical protein
LNCFSIAFNPSLDVNMGGTSFSKSHNPLQRSQPGPQVGQDGCGGG